MLSRLDPIAHATPHAVNELGIRLDVRVPEALTAGKWKLCAADPPGVHVGVNTFPVAGWADNDFMLEAGLEMRQHH